MKKFIIIFTIIAFFVPSITFAHPGRTAGDGCHYCRTNCYKWGVPAGVRHCHGRAESPIQKVSNHKYYGDKTYFVRKVKVHQAYQDQNSDTKIIVYSKGNSGIVQEIFCHFPPDLKWDIHKMKKVQVKEHSSLPVYDEYFCDIGEMNK